MPVPLYQAKAEFFRMLGHPVRIRVLELLQDGPLPVRDLLADLQIEASSLSQQLGLLRRAGVVTSRKDGSSVIYSLAAPEIIELLAVARRVLAVVLAGQVDVLRDLEDAIPSTPPAGRR